MKKTYFLSDAHLGALVIKDQRAHEMRLVNFLDSIKHDAEAVYLLGDMFDFWYEYKLVVPKGHVRFLGKLAELVDMGIDVHFFIGNHDIWTFGYLEKEIGLKVHREPEEINIHGKNFFLAHGDGLYDKSLGFKIIRWIFHNRALQVWYTWVPPRIGLAFGYLWSKNNRINDVEKDYSYMGEDKEHLVLFAKEYSETHPVDYFLFGHRHILLDLQLKNKSRVVIIGDWFEHFSYAVFDGNELTLEQLEA
ncbi:MAG: UDP-2,3-diacylglucosamine diphosphatase [Paludibacteraceae bacterium]|nr:UDP-2,3-diacylglucosamine diphosphatase [Paludibacteraceae bacterium]